jgi:hypothetical protein
VLRLPHCLALVALITNLGCTPTEKSDAPNGKDEKQGEGKTDEPTIKTVDHADVGTACVSGSVDQPHEVTVDFGICLSSSCDTLVAASCTVEQSGVDLKVSGKATVTSDAGPDGICTTDCRRAAATCSVPALAAGTYTLSYAGKQIEFAVPVGAEQGCTPFE